MGYWSWGLVTLILTIGIIVYVFFNFHEKLMEYMKRIELGYSVHTITKYYNDQKIKDVVNDRRHELVIGTIAVSLLLSFLAWFVFLIAYVFILSVFLIKDNEKFKKIVEILKD